MDESLWRNSQTQLNCGYQSLPSQVVSGPAMCPMSENSLSRTPMHCTLCTGWVHRQVLINISLFALSMTDFPLNEHLFSIKHHANRFNRGGENFSDSKTPNTLKSAGRCI